MAEQGEEQRLLDLGLGLLRDLLGADWQVVEYNVSSPQPSNLPFSSTPTDGLNHVVTVEAQGSGLTSRVLVEVVAEPTPAAISRSLAPRLDLMRRLTGDAAVLVIAPWLSPRTRAVLEDLGYGYLDLTGNTWLRLPRLGVFVQALGDQRDPHPSTVAWTQQLRGTKAGRLVRVLTDVMPPHRGTDLGRASGLSLGYVSRLLTALEEQQLLGREGRVVARVDWPGLLRERATASSLVKAHRPVPMVAQRGIDDVLTRLAIERWDEEGEGRVAVTGSVAAGKVAPLAVGGQLMIHVEASSEDAWRSVRRRLGLLPADSGADVLLLQSAGSEALLGRRIVDGIPYVANSQLILDCLGGPGRLPAQGEKVLERLRSLDEATWRRSSVDDWTEDWH